MDYYHETLAQIFGPSSALWALACRWWPNIECWFSSFVIFQVIRNSAERNPLFLWFSVGVGSGRPAPPPLWIRACFCQMNADQDGHHIGGDHHLSICTCGHFDDRFLLDFIYALLNLTPTWEKVQNSKILNFWKSNFKTCSMSININN